MMINGRYTIFILESNEESGLSNNQYRFRKGRSTANAVNQVV